MSDYNEPSYYEIALTNRQVMVAFVIVLGCLVVAFLAGVWVGRGPGAATVGPDDMRAEEVPLDTPAELEFFSDAETEAPNLQAITDEPTTGTTLAEDLGLSGPPGGGAGTESAPPAVPKEVRPPPATAPTQTPTARPVEPVPTPPTAAVDDPEVLIIQVFSTRDEDQARRLLTRLEAGGFEAFLSPVAVDRSTMYRVRIGPFHSRPEAEDIAGRVRVEYKVDTWITKP